MQHLAIALPLSAEKLDKLRHLVHIKLWDILTLIKQTVAAYCQEEIQISNTDQ